MVAPTDLKAYKSAGGGLGGAINTSDLIQHATHNNLFSNTPGNEAAAGEDYFLSMFLKNTHASEDMNEFKFWQTSAPNPQTDYKWGFDPSQTNVGYRWSPFFTGTGTEFDSTASTAPLQLNHNSLAAWFRTTNAGSEMMIVNKGGIGSETAGQNDSYSLRMTSTNKISYGYEEGTGTDHYVTSPLTYNDGIWHFAVGTFGGANLFLYIDDMETEVISAAHSATPEVNTQPVVIGRNSRASDRFWIGNIDEVRVFNEAISQDHREQLRDESISNPTNLVLEKKFGADDGVIIGQTIPNQLTAPINVDWHGTEAKPDVPNVGTLRFQKTFMIWVWKHVNAGAKPKRDDSQLFAFSFKIPQGGSGTPGSGGGGSGGNPPPVVTNYKICFAGDWGCEDATDEVLDLIDEQNYDFVWGVGDNAYDSDTTCWTGRFKPLRDAGKFDTAYGNHEYSEGSGPGVYRTFMGHSKTYFVRQVQNILFLVIDSNIDCDPGSPQHDFIVSELNKAKTNSSIVWKIALFHHPMFGTPSSHSYNESETVQAFMNLFITNKVSIVVSAHIHNWQRSKLVARNDSSPTSPTVVQSAGPYSRGAGGLVSVVTGGGGHDGPHGDGDLYSLGSTPGFMAFDANEDNGVWEIVASNSGNTLTCSFRNVAGEAQDTFVFNA